MNPVDIAKIAHQANKAYCEAIGDYSQPEWENAPEWQKDSAIKGVKFHLNNDPTPEQSHENWLKIKEAEGWKYGKVKDVEKKEHPCFRPYHELPENQKIKDAIFSNIVKAFKGETECPF